ncbi:MAG: NUDIX domain-containing protein [Caldilineaceae bacterium]
MLEKQIMRLAVDAAIERTGSLLLIEYEDAHFGRHWGFPGGGVEPGESIHAALRREVLEETGAHVTVGRLLLVNEFDPVVYGDFYTDEHELRLLFHCTLAAGTDESDFIAPSVPDPDQIGIGWMPLGDLARIALYPRIGARLHQILTAGAQPDIFNTVL